jgi:hypothetical protein
MITLEDFYYLKVAEIKKILVGYVNRLGYLHRWEGALNNSYVIGNIES